MNNKSLTLMIVGVLSVASLTAAAETNITKACCGCCGGLVGPGSLVFKMKGDTDVKHTDIRITEKVVPKQGEEKQLEQQGLQK